MNLLALNLWDFWENNLEYFLYQKNSLTNLKVSQEKLLKPIFLTIQGWT